ncbi:MAG: 16S rRNA (adenine(1518)-N(6)/adenine(1519)-N(6))-dimethyltransferase RsmA [Acidobacteriia bacterium]|nr:16S rRNA (adenine(1518)-N(6)/adenine(1519)-N(6))-dimethyltransferase RsmA [Terriglobia bacterium]
MAKKFRTPARPRLGQHFLTDRRVRDQVVSSLGLQPSDTVVEIGAGRGFLTEALAPHVKRLWAIEMDPQWAVTLKAAFLDSKRVEVIAQDVLKVDFHHFVGAGEASPGLRVVGNLPYYISSPILFHLFEYADLIRDATLMVQRELAVRITATPTSKDYGYASLVTQLFSQAGLLFQVSPSSFSPPPRVHSSMIRLVMSPRAHSLAIDDTALFLKFAQQIFLEKRKTLLNNLKRFIVRNSPDTAAQLQEILRECSLDLKVRAENVPIESTALLYRTLRHRGLL